MIPMKYKRNYKRAILKIALIAFLIFTSAVSNAQQRIGFGIHADPVISWFSTDVNSIKNNGARPGFNFGLTFNKYFAQNYSFSAGISILSAGGKLVTKDTTVMDFSNFKSTVLPGSSIVYKIQYLAFPVGLKLETNQIGYLTFFSDLGLVPKVVINRKVDIPSANISNQNASNELRIFNMSYHISGGIEYSLGGTTSLLFGLDFDNNFLDITKENNNQPKNRVSQKILSFRFGVNF
jgi:hypothetical protein